MEDEAQRQDRPNGKGATLQPSASVWPLIAVLGAAIGLPGLVHGLPLALQVTLVSIGMLVGLTAAAGWVRYDLFAPVRAARWQLMTTPVDPPAPYSPPTSDGQSEAGAAPHERVVEEIARLRFGFPTDEYRDYRTYVNQPANTMGVQMPGGSIAYPDIVVVQSPENYAKIVAQVETAETINEDVAFYEWGPYGELAPLYLYVPVGKGDEALAICRRLDVPVVGIRTWRHNVAHDEIEINDYYTV
jgi:hypothetical protein